MLRQEQLSSGSTCTKNDPKCAELGWKCIPLAVECYGAWGPEALKAFSQVATRLAIRGNTSKSMAFTDLFGRLSHSLIRANARAILSSSYSHLVQQVDELCLESFVCESFYLLFDYLFRRSIYMYLLH